MLLPKESMRILFHVLLGQWNYIPLLKMRILKLLKLFCGRYIKLAIFSKMMASFSAHIAAIGKSLLLALLLINIYFIVYFIVFTNRNYFHSDSAVKNLLAQEIYETGQYFPPEWNYANGDLFVFFGHTFILPLLPFFQNSFSLHAVSGVFSAVLILVGTWCLAGVLTESFWGRLATVAVVSSGISGIMAEIPQITFQ